MSDIAYRFLQEADESRLLDLLVAAFGRWPTIDVAVDPIEHLRWKLRWHDPDHIAHAVADKDGALVAAQLGIIQPYKVHGRTELIFRGWDAAVHPAYRDRGIMTELRAFVREPMRERCAMHVGAFTTNPAMLKLHQQEGRRVVGNQLETMIAPLTLLGAVRALKVRAGRSPAKLARSTRDLARWISERPDLGKTRTNCRVRNVNQFDERVGPLVEETARSFDILLERSLGFLNWRYADPRGGEFSIWLAEEGERLAGYTVLRATGGHSYLADLLVAPDRPDVVDALTSAAMTFFRRARTDAVETLLPGIHPYREALTRSGFVARRTRKVPVSFLPLHMSGDDLAFLSDPGLRIHLTIGDSDTI